MGTADGRVLANSQIWGGMGGQAAKSCVATGWENVAIHEMGHSLFGLADEYEYFRGCGGETDHDYFPELPGIRIEAAEPNITVFGGSGGKWADLIASGTPPPTTSNANCRVCDPQASPVPSGTVGTFEGAGNYHCKIFRLEFNCMMRVTGRPFCAVCRRRIRETIAPYHQIGMSLAPLRVRRIHDYAWLNGFAGGFPNFNEADYGRGLVYGSVLLQPGASERREVAATELGSPDALNLEQCFRAVHDYATANGFVGGFPIFHQADYGQGLVYGCVLVNAAAGEWRDVPANGLCVRPKRLNDAQFVSQAVPAKLSAGEAKPVSVKLRNTGAATWTATAAHRLGAQDPEDNLLWGLNRVRLAAATAPGATATFQFNMLGPSTPGTYTFQWRMVQDGVEWFGDFTPQVAVRVLPPGGPTTVPTSSGSTRTRQASKSSMPISCPVSRRHRPWNRRTPTWQASHPRRGRQWTVAAR